MADTLVREAIAYGSQPLSPVPQYWDGSSYAKVQGVNGAIRVINYNTAGETLTNAIPGTVQIVTSAGATNSFSASNPAHVQLTAISTVNFSGSGTVVISGTATVNFSGSGTVVVSGTSTVSISGTSTVNFSGNGTVEIVSSSGGTAYFSNTNPGITRALAATTNNFTIYTATATWSSGTTATSSQTLIVGVITALATAATNEIVATNDGPYAVTLNLYKTISANSSTFNTSAIATVIIPAEITSAGVTINATRTVFTGLFNFNTGLIFRLTVTAAFTATVTNNVIIKEAY